MKRLMHQVALCFFAASLGALARGAEDIPDADEMEAHLRQRPELDVIRWMDEERGAPLQVRILRAEGRKVTLQKSLRQQTVTRKLALSDLAGVSIHPTEVERQLMDHPHADAVPALRVLWDARKDLLGLEDASVATTGMALAKSLRHADPVGFYDTAKSVLDEVRSTTTSPALVAEARAEQQILDLSRSVLLGPKKKTDEIAWAITESEEHAEAMLMATAWLADRHFEDLKNLEVSNPRWDEDDEIRPIRERLYHLSLDFAVYPSLFHPMYREEAANGLLKAWRVYLHAGDSQLALQTLEDIASLYSKSAAARSTADELARLRAHTPSAHGEQSPDETVTREESEEENATLPEIPPPPKRYNLFQD